MAQAPPPPPRSSLRMLAKRLDGMDPTYSTSLEEGSTISEIGTMAGDMPFRRWDGLARMSTDWDGLRRDPELWFPDGNCLVYLYGYGQSRRGAAFQLPLNPLLAADCHPLLDKCMAEEPAESPVSRISRSQPGWSGKIEFHVPAPQTTDRGEAFLYNLATRNFFAWVFGRPLVGAHLGGALVGLLNSMNEFRSAGQDNIQAMMDYMREAGYADMRNNPDHALGILFFAEHFRFKDLWLDAFCHCTGMHERLPSSPGFGFISEASRSLITSSRLEMDMRLAQAGRKLGSFLSEDLSDAHLGLPSGARAHLDKFRSFLHSYYVAKLGYYPPKSPKGKSTAFPKNVYKQMRSDFKKLYDFLVDSQHTLSDSSPVSQQGGICVLQNVQAFDARHKFSPLPHPFPLLPEIEDRPFPKLDFSRRLSFCRKDDKTKPPPRLVNFSLLSKATNYSDRSLFDCSLVRCYQGFEKECAFATSRADKSEKLSPRDARKVRWILIYSIYQTLLSVTEIPKQVSATQHVPYHLCVSLAGCPPWNEEQLPPSPVRTLTDETKEVFTVSQTESFTPESASGSPEIKPDVDYFAMRHRSLPTPERNASTTSFSRKGTIRRALSTLGSFSDLRLARSKRASYGDMRGHSYGNSIDSTRTASSITFSAVEYGKYNDRAGEGSPVSPDSGCSSVEDVSHWSDSSTSETDSPISPITSVFNSRRGSDASMGDAPNTIEEFLDKQLSMAEEE